MATKVDDLRILEPNILCATCPAPWEMGLRDWIKIHWYQGDEIGGLLSIFACVYRRKAPPKHQMRRPKELSVFTSSNMIGIRASFGLCGLFGS
jgi:hypothetical protein